MTTLKWDNLSAFAGTKEIIKSISGEIHENKIKALLGTSGAGKTTLLNVVSGRSEFRTTGHITKIPVSLIGYVEQELHAYEHQTVLETLEFICVMKNENKIKALEIIKKLNLEESTDTRICSLSGGERKRVSIAVELIGDPEILLLDEPTSGLDSFNALQVLSIIANLNTGVLMTIHQPSAKMMEYLTEIILMADGHIVYSGTFMDCVKFFEECGYFIPPLTSPMEYFLEVISIDTTSPEKNIESKERIRKVYRKWCEKNLHPSPENIPEVRQLSSFGTIVIRFRQGIFPALIKRNVVNMLRNRTLIISQIAQKLVFTFLLGLTYLQLGYEQKDIQSRIGVITFLLLNSFFSVGPPIFNVFPSEKKAITRERRSGCYSGFAAYYSKFIAEIPFVLVFSLLYISAVYWMANLNNNPARFFIFLCVQAATLIFSVAFALTVSVLSPSQNISQVIGSTSVIIFVVFGNLFNNPQNIPAWLRWIIWISPVSYGYKGSVRTILLGQNYTCSGQGNCFTTGEEVLLFYGVGSVGVWTCFLILLGFAFIYSLVGAFALHWKTKPKDTP